MQKFQILLAVEIFCGIQQHWDKKGPPLSRDGPLVFPQLNNRW